MTDDYKQGFITGLAMNPLYVVAATKEPSSDNNITVMDGIYADMLPFVLVTAKKQEETE